MKDLEELTKQDPDIFNQLNPLDNHQPIKEQDIPGLKITNTTEQFIIITQRYELKQGQYYDTRIIVKKPQKGLKAKYLIGYRRTNQFTEAISNHKSILNHLRNLGY